MVSQQVNHGEVYNDQQQHGLDEVGVEEVDPFLERTFKKQINVMYCLDLTYIETEKRGVKL